MVGKVTVNHGFALGAINDVPFEQTTALMAEAGVSVIIFGPGSSPMLPLKKLAAAGVKVFAGSDAIRDTWWPFGNGDWWSGYISSSFGWDIDATTTSNRYSTSRPMQRLMYWDLRTTGLN